MNEYASLTELGTIFGVTRTFVGKRLKELGLRTPDGRPTARAFDEKFVSKRWVPDRPGIYLWTWHREQTTAVLEEAGLRKVTDVAFASRKVGTVGHEILADGVVVAWAADAVWAARIVAALSREA
jgi:hypothetical protein